MIKPGCLVLGCQITDLFETSHCNDDEIVSPDGWSYAFNLITDKGDDNSDPSKPVVGMTFFASNDSDSHDSFEGIRGPTSVEVRIELAGTVIADIGIIKDVFTGTPKASIPFVLIQICKVAKTKSPKSPKIPLSNS